MTCIKTETKNMFTEEQSPNVSKCEECPVPCDTCTVHVTVNF